MSLSDDERIPRYFMRPIHPLNPRYEDYRWEVIDAMTNTVVHRRYNKEYAVGCLDMRNGEVSDHEWRYRI